MKKPKSISEAPSGETYWGRLTDEELLRISFVTDDPENLENLVLEVPITSEKPIVEFAYDFRGSKRKEIRCAHCCYPNHKAGFVIKSADGSRFLCGHYCGDKIYGADFDALHKDFSHARDRARSLRRITNMRAALPAFLRYLDTMQREPSWGIYQSNRQELINQMPRLRGALQIAIERKDGALTVEEQVRDYAAEARDEDRYEREMEEWKSETVTERKKLRREGYEPSKPHKPIYTTSTRQVGTISMPTLFSTIATPRKFVDDIANQFENLRTTPADRLSEEDKRRVFGWKGRKDAGGGLIRTLYVPTKDMDLTLKQIGILLQRIEEQIDRLAELIEFFQPANLVIVAQWATANNLAGSYNAGLNSLTYYKGDVECTVTIHPAFKVPSKTGLIAFRNAIDKN